MSDGEFFRSDFVEQHAVSLPRPLGAEAFGEAIPKILWTILVKQGEIFLDLYLECLLRQTYPKDKICVYIRTNNNTDKTLEIIHAWADRSGKQYNRIIIDDRDLDVEFGRKRHHEWTAERLEILGMLRNESLAMARRLDCAFYFVSDVDNFITPNTLFDLASLRLPIVAPLLRKEDPHRLWSNYFSDINEAGFRLQTTKYNAILTRAVTGVIEVPLVHCTYLVRSDVIPHLTYTSPKGGYEFMIFAESARRAGIPQYIDNRQVYGYSIGVDPMREGARDVVSRARQLISASWA